MSENRKGRSRRLHASLKADGGQRSGAILAAKIAFVAALGAGAVYGLCLAIGRLHDVWVAQCVVSDARAQVTVRTTPHISEDLVRGLFGLTNGCNLALIDFEAKRDEILREQPIMHRLEVTRRLPDRLEISAEERKPVARVNYSSMKIADGRGGVRDHGRWDVVDAEGIVFNFKLDDTKLLPRIVETSPSAKRGQRLSGKALSAVRLIDLCSRRELAGLKLLDVNVSNGTYLIAATDDYNTIKIDWTFVDDPTSADQPHLEGALRDIRKIAADRLASPLRCTYFVNESGRVTMRPSDRETTR